MALDGAGVRLLLLLFPAAAAARSGDRSGELEQCESRLVFNARRGLGGALAYNGCL